MTIETRFWDKVEKIPDGCWEWTANKTNGYGRFRVDAKLVYAHRFAFETLVGPIPAGLDLDHICHNRACVKPNHLRPCTNRENGRNRMINTNSTSGFKGVHWDRANKKWRALIQINGKQVHLGHFATPEAAHAAYCAAATEHFGDFANFGKVV